MVPNAALLIAIARQRVLDLQSSARSARIAGGRAGGSSYRLEDGTWIRPRRESS